MVRHLGRALHQKRGYVRVSRVGVFRRVRKYSVDVLTRESRHDLIDVINIHTSHTEDAPAM